MDTSLLIDIGLNLGIFAGAMVLMLMFAMISFKLQAEGKWLVELNDNGNIEYHLVGESSQSRVSAQDGEYVIPETPRMYSLWPFGLPKFMQVVVRHEKYIKGEELPLQLPSIVEFTNTAENTNRLVNANIVKGIVEMLDDNTTLELVLKKYFPIVVITLVVIAGAAAGAAYFSYQTNQESQLIMNALKTALGEL